MAIDDLREFNLAGGTALALQIGHRTSFDLDFFGQSKISIDEIILSLGSVLSFQEMHRTQNILVLDVQGVKVDFVKYSYPKIKDLKVEDDIRLFSIEDIAAMKLDAIKGRGKKRDFYDLYFLLKKFDLKTLLEFHLEKFKQNTWFLILKSLIYFDDAENDPPIKLLDEMAEWEIVKSTIIAEVNKINT